MKALIGAFNKERPALLGAFSMIVKSSWTFVSSSRSYPAHTLIHSDECIALCSHTNFGWPQLGENDKELWR